MVVKKVLRWSPWAPPSPLLPTSEYSVTIRVIKLVCSLSQGEVAVRIKWNIPSAKGYIRKTARKVILGTTVAKPVSFTGTIGFRDEFRDVCSSDFEVSFSVLHSSGNGKKMEEMGTKSVKIAEWMNGDGNSKELQRKMIYIPLRKQNDSAAEALLCVDASIMDTSEIQIQRVNVTEDSETKDDTSDDSSAGTTSSSSSSEAGLSPDSQLKPASKKKLFSWGKRRKSKENKKINPFEDQDPNGQWEYKEITSQDGHTKLKVPTFFASIDQRDETAGGESACTALAAVISSALHSTKSTPTRSEFNSLILRGSSHWRDLCNNPSYIALFPNKHFDLDTVLESNITPIKVNHDKSYIGFFQPESFKSLHGAMSFDEIWAEISRSVTFPRVYIVSWNDHFFVLKMEEEVFYVVDTLGERLYEGCAKAYMLRFDETARIYDGEKVVCEGKECCGEFIKRFLAAITVKEELEAEEKGLGCESSRIHRRLQIEFHLTETV